MNFGPRRSVDDRSLVVCVRRVVIQASGGDVWSFRGRLSTAPSFVDIFCPPRSSLSYKRMVDTDRASDIIIRPGSSPEDVSCATILFRPLPSITIEANLEKLLTLTWSVSTFDFTTRVSVKRCFKDSSCISDMNDWWYRDGNIYSNLKI